MTYTNSFIFIYGMGEERIKIANDNWGINGMFREEKLRELNPGN